MKNLLALTGFIILSMSASLSVFAQENEETEYSAQEAEYPAQDDKQPKFFFVFTEGATCSWLTRIIKQSGRSNFVFEDFLPGVYSRVDFYAIKNFTPMLRVALLYPLTSTFNKVPQKAKTPLHIGADFNLGVNFNLLEFKYFRLNLGPAFHIFFLNSDRWNYLNLGASAFVGMEVPIAKRWTIVCGGLASLDSGNFGGNRDMEPFDIAYQYQIDLGVRYSKKLTNRTALFPLKQQSPEMSVLSR